MHFLELNENVWILIEISFKFVPNGPINDIPAFAVIMAWRQPLSGTMMVRLPTHISVTWPQWVKHESCQIWMTRLQLVQNASVNYPSLVQIMAWRLLGAKPLLEPMLEYCWFELKEQIPVKSRAKFKHFHSRKCIWKCPLWNGGHVVLASMC